MTAIDIKGLTKRFGDRTAVDGLTLSIEDGELFSLLGVNGAGKTTTIRMLTGLLPPDGGDAELLGCSIVSDPGVMKPWVAVSPQESAIAPNLTVEENLHLMAGIYSMEKEYAREKIPEVMAAFGLDEYAGKRAKTLSGGWQRRLSIAMALVTEPRILFLDEPTLGLDVLARRELWAVINGLKGKVTVVLTTHYMEEAEALSDRIGIMAKGTLRAVGTPAELIARTGANNFEDAFVRIAQEGRAVL